MTVVEIDPAGPQVYCDGPTLEEISGHDGGVVRGYTFNPTLFRGLGVVDYASHSRKVVDVCRGLPVSLEVFADDEGGMIEQAVKLSEFGDLVEVNGGLKVADPT